MNYKNGRIITKKQDKGMRGIGLRSVKATVEKHTETVDIEHNDTDFFVKIIYVAHRFKSLEILEQLIGLK